MEQSIIHILKSKQLTLSVSESMTGGLLAYKLISIAGASHVFKGGLVCYQDQIKIDVLKVNETLIQTYGVVSKEVAYAMAIQTIDIFQSDIAVSITGYAESPQYAYMTFKVLNHVETHRSHYPTLDRVNAISFVTDEALRLLEKMLLSL
jgi:PncC family amidohydrolase